MCNIYWAVKRFLLLFMWHEINFVSFTLITNTFIISFTSAFILIAQKTTKHLPRSEFPLGQRSWGNEPAIWRLKHRNFQNSILFTPSHILCQPPPRGMNRTKGSEACDQSLHSKDQFSTWLRAFPSLSHSETRTRMAVIYPFIFYELISLWWQMLRYLDDV